MSRQLIIEVIREAVRGLPVEEVQTEADGLPTHVVEGSLQFCKTHRLGNWFRQQIVAYNISPADELYAFIQSTQADVQNKEATTSGDKRDDSN